MVQDERWLNFSAATYDWKVGSIYKIYFLVKAMGAPHVYTQCVIVGMVEAVDECEVFLCGVEEPINCGRIERVYIVDKNGLRAVFT